MRDIRPEGCTVEEGKFQSKREGGRVPAKSPDAVFLNCVCVEGRITPDRG